MAGKLDANLGGNVLKQRLAREGRGKSGGFQTIIFFRQGERLIFAFGFAKSSLENLSRAELEAFKLLASEFLGYDAGQISELIASGEWQDMIFDG